MLREPLWIDYEEGERLTIFYRGWRSHFEWYVNDLQWFERMVGRFLAGNVAGLGLKDLDGNRIEDRFTAIQWCGRLEGPLEVP